MVEIITYSLKNEQKNSDQYYQDVAAFADLVIQTARDKTEGILQPFQNHIQQKKLEILRTEPEYLFEFVTLGMLYKIYAGEALEIAQPTRKVLSWLYTMRTNYRTFKPLFDWFRGKLSGLLIRPKPPHPAPRVSFDNLAQLLNWMEATGEFTEETERLALWADYLETLPAEEQAKCLEAALSLAGWFTTESEKHLGKYTPNVETFLRETHPSYTWREDRFFCGRKREEYHLNMVGTEVLNRAFRETFLALENKVVLLPPCMKAKQDGTCQAVASPFGDLCAHCTTTCRIHQITQLGEKYGFKVAIIPHELSVFSSGEMKAPSDQKIGIVGVSCPVTNVTGGWETKKLGIPAQGVLLDYCGCYWHWHDKGIPTDINLNQLLNVISPPSELT
jgi:hypothetical protein